MTGRLASNLLWRLRGSARFVARCANVVLFYGRRQAMYMDAPPRHTLPSGGKLFKSPFPLPPEEMVGPLPQPPELPEDEEHDTAPLWLLQQTHRPPHRLSPYDSGLDRKQDWLPPAPATRNSRRRTLWRSAFALVLLTGCASLSFLGVKFYRLYSFAQSVTGKALPTVTIKTAVPQATPLSSDLANVPAFNLLLLGSDNDSKPQFKNAVLTQTDIVVRVDLAHHRVTMVSIPRDMYIKTDYGVCCLKLDEISGAETDGATDPLNAKLHGFAHTAAAIEADFGIPINAFAWVGLDGFVKVIDTVGGVDVDVLHPVVDDAYPQDVDNEGNPYAYQRLYIPAGPQHLDGLTALEYVRSRHSDLAGDFGRSQRQQSVLVALKKKLDNPAMLAQLDEIAGDLQGSVLTSLTIPQIVWLANWARTLPSNAIAQDVLSVPRYGSFQQVPTAGGAFKSIIQPNWGAINQTIRQIFPNAVAQIDLSQPSAANAQIIRKEGARILVENGSGVSGVAAKLASILKSDGFNVVGAQNAEEDRLATQLEQFNANDSGTAGIIGQMLGVPVQAPGIAGPKGADIVIVIGKDLAAAIQQAT